MNQNNQKNNGNGNNNGNDAAFGMFIIALVGCAVWHQKQALIKMWFYENLMSLIAYGFLIVAALVAIWVYRTKKKNENELLRLRALQTVKPTRDIKNYYERRF
jgi:magnesium-transporting ATPase (P-type)